jgi:hypothetical protein
MMVHLGVERSLGQSLFQLLEQTAGLFNALCFGLTERGDFSLFRSGSV